MSIVLDEAFPARLLRGGRREPPLEPVAKDADALADVAWSCVFGHGIADQGQVVAEPLRNVCQSAGANGLGAPRFARCASP